jgi:tetratricopeptide (TPR) repeat protein
MNSYLFGQNYKDAIHQKKFSEALTIIQSKLDDIYSKRSIEKQIPTTYVAIEKIEEGVDLQKIFSERKIQPYFIENNDTLYALHADTALCYQNIYKYHEALQHYFQALRFTTIGEKDHTIFYSIAQIFKKINKFNAYVLYLEEAYEIKPDNYDYSLELSLALSSGKNKKKALFHLNRYIASKGDSVPPNLYLIAANCYESIGDYIKASEQYTLYLHHKPNDYAVLFALGYLAYTKISDMKLAYKSFINAIPLFNENDWVLKGLSYTMLGDIECMDLNYKNGLEYYLQSIAISENMKKIIDEKKANINTINDKINVIKSTLLANKDIALYPQYQTLMDELGNNELELRQLEHEYSKLNAGLLSFKIAVAHENMMQFAQAIEWYNKTIEYGIKIRESSKKIEKLQLKISRGF